MMLLNSHAMQDSDLPLVKVDGLTKLFPLAGNLFRKPTGFVHAVDGVSFELAARREPGPRG